MLAQKNPEEYTREILKANNNLGKIFLSEKQYELALVHYNNILEIHPDDLFILTQKGCCLLHLKRLDESHQCYEKVAEINPSDANAWYNLACIESLQNRVNASMDFLSEAIKLDKKYVEMAETDAEFELIRNTQQFKKLIEKYRKTPNQDEDASIEQSKE